MPMIARQDKNMMRIPDTQGTEQITASDLLMGRFLAKDPVEAAVTVTRMTEKEMKA